MNKFKRVIRIALVLSILIVNFFIPLNDNKVEAKTLRDLKDELAAKEKELASGLEQKKLTEQEIENKRQNISNINVEIDNIHKEVETLTKEIETLNEEIKKKEQEIKDIINYYQISNGESAYLEYVFDAADFTDFIYRMAIAEQLSNYNDKLIKEYNETIKKNEQKKKDLANKEIELNEKQKSLEKELASLGSQLGEIMDENVSVEDDIKSVKSLIETYESMNCGLDQDLTTCGDNSTVIPSSNEFYRPVVTGRVSANYGIYYPYGYAMQHYGMDLSRMGHGANVYPIAFGKVAYITERSSCGGNMLYIWHTVNGKAYTSGYFHLADITVKVGDVVTPNTVIAHVGGSSLEYWDSCSTGTHLHLQLATTHIAQGLSFYSRFAAKHFNPRDIITFPPEGEYFYDRTTKY